MKPDRRLLLFPFLIALNLSSTPVARAGSATWSLNPTNSDWNTAANWSPATVPDGPADIASFALSNNHSVSFSKGTTLDSIVFDAGALSYAISNGLPKNLVSIAGGGIVNHSGNPQNLINGAGAKILLQSSATISDQVTITNNGSDPTRTGGILSFRDNSSAGHALLINEASQLGGFGGITLFKEYASAANATIISNGSDLQGLPGGMHFRDRSTAANATLISNGGNGQGALGAITFLDGKPGSTAANATVIANGGTNGGQGGAIYLWYDTSGGTARFEVFGNGKLDVTNRSLPRRVTVGSIEGEGTVSLGGTMLIVGGNNLSTTYAGVITDLGVEHSSLGSLVKQGNGTLQLTGSNLYTGGTSIQSGELVVNNTLGSATGTASVQVAAGVLSGGGTIEGQVNVGTGVGSGALLRPGNSGVTPGTLTINAMLRFDLDGSYLLTLNSNTGATAHVVARGISIRGATILFDDLGNSKLSAGTILTVIDNPSANPINGTFGNLPDGSTVLLGQNTFQVSYQGGDGNDLILTVQP